MTHGMSQNRNRQACIDSCLKAYEVCTRTLATGLEINEDQDFIKNLQLCSQVCQLTSQALLLNSDFETRLCLLCADICTEVAELCEDFEEDEMRICAEVCLKCAKACRMMGSHPSSHLPLQSDIRLV
jgi:hypothetical protein